MNEELKALIEQAKKAIDADPRNSSQIVAMVNAAVSAVALGEIVSQLRRIGDLLEKKQ